MRGYRLVSATRGLAETVTPNDPDTPQSSPAPRATHRSQPIVDSHELFRGASEILISHDGAIYRMRITRQGKLILNK
ncbi:hemin uptake protein HemP [Sinorhizobium fredii]|nr:hemin uptake protein HemP [Sinorhizobium fredii]ASY69968.1 Hemin uptake protein [Sinorhizobium fredii CCBAU 83666]AWI58172.1 hypothetical protein AB395_00002521 [Sinorhizobium fredii CCBAU 45436]AWM26013.1 Hemin uptake protein [Sinorhizobium fredii CCBAU 25509]KSV91725.1 hemin transporter [Sinorhizobium fredii USDA 205]GEC30624.1 hemin transporter [Sinorhizobium fredii]